MDIGQAEYEIGSEEPLKTLRNYFDVYSVTAVSKHDRFGNGYSTAIGCELEGNGSTGISGDENAVIQYVSKIERADIVLAGTRLGHECGFYHG